MLLLLRQVYKLLFFIVGTLLLISLHCIWLLLFVLAKPSPYPRFFIRVWYKFILWLFGVRVQLHGKRLKPQQHQIFYVSNHISYLDILVLGAYFPCFFVAKADIASWPIFGFLSKIGGTIFISRNRAVVKQQAEKLETALQQGNHLCIFPEGTTSNGQQILPFKSSLLQPLYATTNTISLAIQPLSLRYTSINGRKLLNQNQFDKIAYYGDHVFGSHSWQLLKLRRIGVRINIHPHITLDQNLKRKDLCSKVEAIVQHGFSGN
jgi:lyso-ornithine lipid O-acyltransferase